VLYLTERTPALADVAKVVAGLANRSATVAELGERAAADRRPYTRYPRHHRHKGVRLMTDKQRLELLGYALKELRRTKEGYKSAGQTGGHWRRAMQRLDALEEDLKPKAAQTTAAALPGLPKLGPVWNGGKSILEQDCTHATSGIPRFPAFDDAFVAGRKIIAPEALEVTRASSSRPGKAFFAKGRSGLQYWFGHLVKAPSVGTKFRKGETMGVVLDHNIGGGPHVHVAINIERIVKSGKQLEHHTNYTHGARLIGKQLEELLK
jgi:hypothetical protein